MGRRPRYHIREAIQECPINRNAFSADFGFTGGTTVNVISKSGTNSLHGSGDIYCPSYDTARTDYSSLATTNASKTTTLVF